MKPRSRRPKIRRRSPCTLKLAAPELFVGSFLLLILLGAFALAWSPGVNATSVSSSVSSAGLSSGTTSGTSLNMRWMDAVFTATSAVCVTGLIVVDTATYFSPIGQAIVLLLIQFGGLGMLLIMSVIISALGGRPSLGIESMAHGTSHLAPRIPVRKLISHILLFTVVIESLGAAALYLDWGPRMGWSEALWPSVFHSVSAFCNAGFSTNTDSLMPYQKSPESLLIISVLVVVGGIGFITIEELYQRFYWRRSYVGRLSLHSKLVLATTGILLFGATPMFAAFEWNGALSHLRDVDKWVNAFFMSVTPRTAGFNSVDYAVTSDCSNFLTILLMLVGGSPGSTAGGLKTTTLAVLVLLAWSRLRGYRSCVFNYRSIPDETVQRATGVFVVVSGVFIASIFAIALLERHGETKHSLLEYAFEVASALGTVGMSMGITSSLNDYSKALLIVLMIVGRVGPLVIASVLIARLSRQEKHRYSYEDVVVG